MAAVPEKTKESESKDKKELTKESFPQLPTHTIAATLLAESDGSERETKQFVESEEFAAGLVALGNYPDLIDVRMDGKQLESTSGLDTPKIYDSLFRGEEYDIGEFDEAFGVLTEEEKKKVVVFLHSEGCCWMAVTSNLDFLRGLMIFYEWQAPYGFNTTPERIFNYDVKGLRINSVNIENPFEFVKAHM